MLWTALQDPDPVLIFEHGTLYNVPGRAGRRRRPGRHRHAPRSAAPGADVTLVTYGGTLPKALDAAEQLAAEGIEAEVVDLRTLRPLDDATILASVAQDPPRRRRRRGLAQRQPLRRGQRPDHRAGASTTSTRRSSGCAAPRCPIPYARHLEEAALPPVERIVAAARRGGGAEWVSSGCRRSAPTWSAGTLVEWLVKPGDTCTAATSWRWWTPTRPRSRSRPSTTGSSPSCSSSPARPCRSGTPLARITETPAEVGRTRRQPAPPRHLAPTPRPPPRRRCRPPPAAPARAGAAAGHGRSRGQAPPIAPRCGTWPTGSGVDPATIHGTGTGGAITRADVERRRGGRGRRRPAGGAVLAAGPAARRANSASSSPPSAAPARRVP